MQSGFNSRLLGRKAGLLTSCVVLVRSLKLEEDTLAADKASASLNSARKPANESKRAAAAAAAADQASPHAEVPFDAATPLFGTRAGMSCPIPAVQRRHHRELICELAQSNHPSFA